MVWPGVQTVDVAAGEAGEFSVFLRNRSWFPLTITTYDSSCSCTTTTALPLEIEGWSEQEVVFGISPSSGGEGNVSLQRIRFYCVPVVAGLECDVSIQIVSRH